MPHQGHTFTRRGGLPTPWMQNPRWMQNSTPSPVDRMTDTCKNITLPQTLFAGSNYFRPPTKLLEGNVFIRLYLSVCLFGGPMLPLPMMHWISPEATRCQHWWEAQVNEFEQVSSLGHQV